MKKIYIVASLAFATSAFAQITTLVNFNNTSTPYGANPNGSLMQASDGMLYGMTEASGANGMGVLFQYNPSTNTYIDKYDFTTANGSKPTGSLMQASDGMLYGMTYAGGTSTVCTNGCGVLFQYNPTTNTYTKKLDFDGTTNGKQPSGSLIQASDGMLYGMTSRAGANGDGVLFQFNPTTSTYTKKLDFYGSTNGKNPYGSLMQASDGMLYGMTSAEGASGGGVLFQYNPTTSTYIDKYDFIAANGSTPMASLIQASDGMLYGMTYGGGAISLGVIFQYNPITNTYTKEFDFDGNPSGKNPGGSLIQASNGMLYGMAPAGGASGSGAGVLFQYNPVTSIYTSEFGFFGGTNGSTPMASLIQASDGNLYGMTDGGGTSTNCNYGCGTLFKFGGAAGIKQVANNNQVSIYPNPASSSLQVTFSGNIQNTTLLITDMLGNTVKQSILYNPTSIINIADLAEGIYNVSISSNEGVVNKRLVIVR